MHPFALSLLATTALVTCGCSGGARGGAGLQAPRSVAGVRAATLVQVARRIYDQEVTGGVGRASLRRISRDATLTRALGDGDARALRAEALRQLFMPGKHVVRLRVVRNGRVLVD